MKAREQRKRKPNQKRVERERTQQRETEEKMLKEKPSVREHVDSVIPTGRRGRKLCIYD